MIQEKFVLFLCGVILKKLKLGNETDDIVKRLINSFLSNYQKEELILRNGSNFVFGSVGLLSYHIHKTSLKRVNSYIKSPEWIANKKVIINMKNVDEDVLNILWLLHYVIRKLKAIQKEYKAIIIYFLVIIIGRVYTFQQE